MPESSHIPKDYIGERTLISTAPIPETPVVVEPARFDIPRSAKTKVEGELLESDTAWERLDKNGRPPTTAQIREDIGGIALTAGQVEERAKAEDAQARALARTAGGTHPRGRRGKKHIFDDNSASVRAARGEWFI